MYYLYRLFNSKHSVIKGLSRKKSYKLQELCKVLRVYKITLILNYSDESKYKLSVQINYSKKSIKSFL